MKIPIVTTRIVDLTQEQLDLLKEVYEHSGIYSTSGNCDMLDELIFKGLTTEASSNLVSISNDGIAVLKQKNYA